VIGAKSQPTGVIAALYGIIEQPAPGRTDSIVLASLASGALRVVGIVMWELQSRLANYGPGASRPTPTTFWRGLQALRSVNKVAKPDQLTQPSPANTVA